MRATGVGRDSSREENTAESARSHTEAAVVGICSFCPKTRQNGDDQQKIRAALSLSIPLHPHRPRNAPPAIMAPSFDTLSEQDLHEEEEEEIDFSGECDSLSFVSF